MDIKRAFTLVELLVAVGIIAILASIVTLGLPSITKRGQDTQRLSEFRRLQLDLETYKNINGRYPTKGNSATNYIAGDPSFVPNYSQKLPQDKPQDSSNGFSYVVSNTGKSYCLAIKNTVFKNSSQPDLVWGEKSWKDCKGSESASLEKDL